MNAAAIKGFPVRSEAAISPRKACRPAGRVVSAFPMPPRRMRAFLRSGAGENPTIRP